MTPLDLDGAALRALRDLCGEVMAARLAWVRRPALDAVLRTLGACSDSIAWTADEDVTPW